MSALASIAWLLGGVLVGGVHARALWSQARRRGPWVLCAARVVLVVAFLLLAIRSRAFAGPVGWLFGYALAVRHASRALRGST